MTGDSLSLFFSFYFLFIVAVEALHLLLFKAEQLNMFKGIVVVATFGFRISDLQFADDGTVIFRKVRIVEALNIALSLCILSGKDVC